MLRKEAEVCLTSKRNCQSTHLLVILEHAFGSGKPTTQEAQEVLLHTLRQVDTFYVYELQFLIWFYSTGFHHSSVGKESACNAGDPSSNPGLGRSPGEGIGHPLQCPWASLVAQLVKNPPTMLALIPGLGRSPGEEIATHSSILACRIPWTVHAVA